MPPLSKMRGVYEHIKKGADYFAVFGVMDTRISKSGQGVAVICQELGIDCHYFFPLRQGGDYLPQWKTAKENGAVLHPMTAGRIGILYARARRECEEIGAYLLPLGLPLRETVSETAKVTATLSPELLSGTIVVSTGTGTILSGIICGLADNKFRPRLTIGVSASMSVIKQKQAVLENVSSYKREHGTSMEAAQEVLKSVTLVRGKGDYYEPSAKLPPFPAHPQYEGKAWEYVVDKLEILPKPILFWNVGQ